MGKLRGFVEYERMVEGYVPVEKRIKNFKEFNNPGLKVLKNIFGIESQYFENKFRYKRSSSGSIDNIANYLIKHEDLKIEEIIDK